MARLAFQLRPDDQPAPPANVRASALVDDPLATDRIGYDAWLLKPEQLPRAERVLRFCSSMAGPVTFTAALAWFVAWIA